MNIPGFATATGVDANMCNTIVGFFFTLSFISIGLTATPKEEGKSSSDTAKQMLKGSLGMGLLWGCFVLSCTASHRLYLHPAVRSAL